MGKEGLHRETPCFNYELEKWLVLYSIGVGPHRFTDIREKMKKVLNKEIVPLVLINMISGLQSEDYIKAIIRNDLVCKEGHIAVNHYFLTKKGRKQLLFGWEFATSAIPKEFYDEISSGLCAICQG